MHNNPFLQASNTPFHTLPFDQISTAHYLPAFEAGFEQARAEMAAITQNPEPPTFANTIAALEFSGQILGRVSECLFNLYSAETNDALQEVARQVSPQLAAHANDVLLNPELFARVKAVWTERATITQEEQHMLLNKTYHAFARNGALLCAADKATLRTIDAELSQLSLQFAENVLADTHEFKLHLTDAADLAGLPESATEAAAEEAQGRNLQGWVFTLDMPSFLPFVTYSDQRQLREKMFRASGSRGFRNNSNNNTKFIFTMVRLRQERAALLGFASHADYVLQERMAKNPDEVLQFLNTLRGAAFAPAQKEFAAIRTFAQELGIADLQRWDSSYVIEKMKKARFDLDDEALKPYFKLEEVVAGMFEVARKLYGIAFRHRTDIPLYHKDVVTYEVVDGDGSHLAVFYTDFFPRKGKRNGAWMTSYRSQKVRNGVEERPHISIVCNFTKPTATKPSLLTFQEVTTLFHEFGHALHGILAQGTYGSISGTAVYWDFVELPSQIMENWCFEKDCLDLFAKHYETGAPIPIEMVLKIRESAAFMEGLATLRQVGLARLDMAWHNGAMDGVLSIEDFEREVLMDTDVFPQVAGVAISPAFSHIFQGSYAAGYYSYKWAEVLDADAFERFLEAGIFNREVAGAFRELLAAGGSVHPKELYVKFRGQEPDPKALLRRAGLVAEIIAPS